MDFTLMSKSRPPVSVQNGLACLCPQSPPITLMRQHFQGRTGLVRRSSAEISMQAVLSYRQSIMACKQCLLSSAYLWHASSAYLAVLTYRQSITANWLVLLLMGYVFLWLIRNLCRQCYSTSIACLPCPTQTPCNHAKNA